MHPFSIASGNSLTQRPLRMKFIAKLRTMLAVLSVTLLFTGCFQVEQVINIKPDGSGTIVMTAIITNEALKQMEEMSKLGGEKGKSPLDEMTDPAKTAAQAKKLGEGVKFEKSEKIKNGIGEGAKFTFSFPDVTKLHVDMDMNEMGPGGGGDDQNKQPITFGFSNGTLTIKSTHKKDAPAKPDDDKDDANAAAGIAMMQQMMKGMKITVAVNIEGTITETDAAHRDGSRITMAIVPFDEVLKDPSKLKALNKADGWDGALKILKEIPGVIVEPKETVTVKIK